MPLLRAIIDTNVVFEGLTKQGGASGLIIDAWTAGLFEACVSTALSYEYEEVLSRKLSNIRWQKMKPVLGTLLESAAFAIIRYTWRPSSPDPGDKHLIDAAMNSGAIVVTSNIRDFKEAERSLGLAIMNPVEFIVYLAAEINRNEVQHVAD